MCHQSTPFVSCYSNRCQYQAACYVSCKRLSENHTGCITIAADNGKRKVEPRFRRASVCRRIRSLKNVRLRIDHCVKPLKSCSDLDNRHLCGRQEEYVQRASSLSAMYQSCFHIRLRRWAHHEAS